ncbi:ATP-binding cassette domain-containing protein [Streptomyces sp. NPDC007205]|uniref:ATP-binding cassette domain-containing protein n=1 Tax=Streptomyces sp. NPDC007205 TaxID=3154316 RepID=UPI0033DC552A
MPFCLQCAPGGRRCRHRNLQTAGAGAGLRDGGLHLLRLQAVSKRYGRGDWILRDVDVEAPAGEVVAFTGGNGSGKSTLSRIAVGLSRPTRGRVTTRPPVVGYVPDRFSPDERMVGTLLAVWLRSVARWGYMGPRGAGLFGKQGGPYGPDGRRRRSGIACRRAHFSFRGV